MTLNLLQVGQHDCNFKLSLMNIYILGQYSDNVWPVLNETVSDVAVQLDKDIKSVTERYTVEPL